MHADVAIVPFVLDAVLSVVLGMGIEADTPSTLISWQNGKRATRA